MLSLDDIRHEMAEYMIGHPRGSLDSAIFHVVKQVYERGLQDGANDAAKMDVVHHREMHSRNNKTWAFSHDDHGTET